MQRALRTQARTEGGQEERSVARAPSAPAFESVLALQQSAGNAATAGVIARAPLTPAENAYTRGLYEKYKDRMPPKYREDSGEFPDTVTGKDILDEPPYELDGTVRKGGFTGSATRLDPAKV